MNFGAQQLRIMGSRVYFQRDAIVLTPGGTPAKQPVVDLGRIDPVSPAPGITTIQLKDSDGGVKRVIAEAVTDVEESYEVRCSNLNLKNLSLLFYGFPPVAFTQATTPLTVTHHAHPGELLKIRNAAGDMMFGLTSITSVGSLVLGTDYEVVSLERGLIRMIAGGAFAAEADISVVYVPRAITGIRKVSPQTSGPVAGEACIIWSEDNNQNQIARVARLSLSPTQAQFDDSNWSSATFRLTILGDPSKDPPAGTLLQWLGTVPPLS